MYTTRQTLLSKIKHGDPTSWEEFYATYRPLAFLHGRRFGMNHQECEDLLQQVMLQFFKGVDRFEYRKLLGRFRSYLNTVIHNTAVSICRKRKDPLPAEEEPVSDEIAKEMLAEWRRLLVNQALLELKNQVEPQTFEAFCLYGLQQRNAREVADYLKINIASVYTAKSRCTAILRELIREIQKHDPEFRL